jgi:DNA polymerase
VTRSSVEPREPAAAFVHPESGGETPSGTAEEYVPRRHELDALRRAAADCHGCDLWRDATQTVFGQGAAPASLMLVGEQPGDKEDVAGSPFVGPAGRVLDSALEEAGIDREEVFVTNVVKHFKWRPQGKRRLHERPNPAEVRACRPWLEGELDAVRPDLVVLLGATAAQSLLGTKFRVTVDHGRLIDSPLPVVRHVMATLHPSAILRARTDADRATQMQILIDDLTVAAQAIRNRPG